MKCNFSNIFLPSFRASITDKDIDEFTNAKQHFSDCYLMTTLETLGHTENGRKILKEQLQYDDLNPNYINCNLYNPNGQKEKYSIPINTVIDKYKKVYEHQQNPIIRSLDISVAEYENKYNAKPWICRFTDNFKTYSFENNLPSHFMQTLTGIKPHVIAETNINLDLRSHKEEVLNLFERMDKEKNHSFVISTGVKPLDGHSWHVYIIENVDSKNKIITVKEKRGNKSQSMTFDEALKSFKFITGYFNSDLAKKEVQQ